MNGLAPHLHPPAKAEPSRPAAQAESEVRPSGRRPSQALSVWNAPKLPALASPAGRVVQRCGGHTCPSGGCHREYEVRFAPSRVRSGAPSVAPASVHQVLATPGAPLPSAVRSDAEHRLGHSFAAVRVHTDSRAAKSAAAVQARAYTVGSHIAFAAGEYQPQTQAGLRLLAHELTHVVQQAGSAPAAAEPSGGLRIEPAGNAPENEANRMADVVLEEDVPAAPIRNKSSANPPTNRSHPGRDLQAPAHSALTVQRQARSAAPQTPADVMLIIPWTGSTQSSIFDFLRAAGLDEERAASVTRVVTDRITGYAQDETPITNEQFSAALSAAPQGFALDENLTAALARASGIPLPRLQRLAGVAGAAERASTPFRLIEKGRVLPGSPKQEREAARWVGPVEPVAADWALLEGNMTLADVYLRLMEHYVGVSPASATRTATGGGFTHQDLLTLIGGNPSRLLFTNLFTQGFREFNDSGGRDVEAFALLEDRIFEQLSWGNPAAARNQLKIGFGIPEDNILGIVERSTGFLLYDASGTPLPSFGGNQMRDTGYIGARRGPDSFSIEISSLPEPWFGILNSLRQQLGDPLRAVGQGAQFYMDNMDLVNAQVRKGLAAEIAEKFEEMLVPFVGFLGGHALSTFLIASVNPVLSSLGAVLKGLLLAAGYIMDINFGSGAVERLLSAGYHLSRVTKKPDGSLTQLSSYHLEQGAIPIRTMLAELAAMWLTARVGEAAEESIGEALRNDDLERIDCTSCRFGRRERRARRRRQEAHELANFERRWTPEAIEAVRRQVRERETVATPQEIGHTPLESHRVDEARMARTINEPEVILLSANGNWVFYRNGTIVMTRAGRPNDVMTAFGTGGTVPPRHVHMFNQLYPGGPPGISPARPWAPRDPEPPVDWRAWMREQTGKFSVRRLWP